MQSLCSVQSSEMDTYNLGTDIKFVQEEGI